MHLTDAEVVMLKNHKTKRGYRMVTMRLGVLGCSLLVLSGCGALPQSIEMEDSRNKIFSSEIVVAIQETPGFLFTTPDIALFDTLTWYSERPDSMPSWKGITSFNETPDFTAEVREKFITAVGSERPYSFRLANKVEPTVDSDDFSRLTSQYDAPYILEFRTKYGSFAHGPLSWNTFFLNYISDATLVRTNDGKAVWRATCTVKASESDLLGVPAEDVLDGSGEDFRAAADYATSSCAEKLSESFING